MLDTKVRRHGADWPLMLTVQRVSRPSTGLDLSDPRVAAAWRDQWLPATAFAAPTVAVLDLSGRLLSPSSLRELIVPLGQGVRGGVYGDLKLVVVSADGATRELLGLLARQHEIPLFLAASAEDIDQAQPVGDLTTSDTDTLQDLAAAGWQLTVSRLAHHAGIAPTAANNRLVNLERKGYVYRIQRHRRHGDLYIDPRATMTVTFDQRPEPGAPRAALVAAGMDTDPYDTSRIVLDGPGVDRAADILRRRGKAK